MNSIDKVYSSKEVALQLNVTTRTVQLWADAGLLESWKTPGGHRRFAKATIDSFYQKINKVQSVAQSSTLRVVIVEDSPELLMLYQLNMMDWTIPIEIITANDGFEGLIRVGAYKPHMLITDLNMPNMNGFQMIQAIRNDPEYAETDIIVVSGLQLSDIQSRGNLPEAIPILGKPIPFKQLEKLVHNKYQSVFGKLPDESA
ncbi:MAG: response regulator [Methylococcaceae bacterium]